jgi:ferredoxin
MAFEPGPACVLGADGLSALFQALLDSGHTVVAPAARDGAIALREIGSAAELPAGKTDEQGPGSYRLKERDDGALFGHAAGPDAPKRWLHPPAFLRFRAHREKSGFRLEKGETAAPKYAFLGIKPCELAAIGRQDRVLLGGPYAEPAYAERRKEALLVVAQCTEAHGTCFCASMGTGPRAEGGFDLALTELLGDGRHELLVETGSERGAVLLAAVPKRAAAPADLEAARSASAHAAATMGRTLPTAGLKQALQAKVESPRWDDVEKRCLSCANCTLVCPTCFCSTIEDTTDLTGTVSERWRRWDSCFTLDFSYIHGGSVRRSGASRYRQWLTHKLASWVDQFGESGCVGCGRCITWCPAGIDLTEEARAFLPAHAGKKE